VVLWWSKPNSCAREYPAGRGNSKGKKKGHHHGSTGKGATSEWERGGETGRTGKIFQNRKKGPAMEHKARLYSSKGFVRDPSTLRPPRAHPNRGTKGKASLMEHRIWNLRIRGEQPKEVRVQTISRVLETTTHSPKNGSDPEDEENENQIVSASAGDRDQTNDVQNKQNPKKNPEPSQGSRGTREKNRSEVRGPVKDQTLRGGER